MRLGRIALAEAEGALVVHTLRLGENGVIKKGHRLTAADLVRLRDAGHATVLAAQLDADDVPEDAAAAAVGAAASGDGVAPAPAATGRCNLHASCAGLLVVEREAVDALNLVDEAVTLATIAPLAPVARGALVGTVKIIPFAVPQPALARCLDLAREHRGLLRVAPFRRRDVGLVLTRLPNLPESLLDRAASAQRLRVERVGCTVARELRCAHDEGAVATALAELAGIGCRLILLLGASAIVDRRDVIPAALARAGGRIEHFGLPVDPGNLLLLGRMPGAGRGGAAGSDGDSDGGIDVDIDVDIDVIGVPGCARSLRRSGYDWVLERLAADLPVTRHDLMRLGVGGLLAEIPTRPQPRLAAAEADGSDEHDRSVAPPPRRRLGAREARIGAVVLAAGQSRRMGAPNKLLCPVEGRPLVAHAVEALRKTPVRPILVVTGHDAAAVAAALEGLPVRFVHNPDFALGLSTSLRTGLSALGPEVDAALICLGDMPRVRPADIEALLGAFDPDDGRAIVVPTYKGQRGNPVLWAARFFPELKELRGDAGARSLLDEHAEQVCRVPITDEGVALDVDTPEDLRALGGAPAGLPAASNLNRSGAGPEAPFDPEGA